MYQENTLRSVFYCIVYVLQNIIRSVLNYIVVYYVFLLRKRGYYMSELKPKSFRIDDETAEKFKEISSTIGGNQQETLAKLIEAYEFQSGKAVLTEKKADIEQFEKYVTAITRMFMGSLDDNRNMQETVRTQFDAQLNSKDTTIRSLQDDNKELKAERDQAVSIRDNLEEQIALLNDRIKNEYEKRLVDAQKMIDDQESHVSLLKGKNQQLEQNAENCKQLQSENVALRQELAEIKRQLESQALEHQKSILELKEQHMNETNELKEKHLKEIEEYQQKYKTELDKRSETQSQTEPKQKKTTTRKTVAKKPDKKKFDETAATENEPVS